MGSQRDAGRDARRGTSVDLRLNPIVNTTEMCGGRGDSLKSLR